MFTSIHFSGPEVFFLIHFLDWFFNPKILIGMDYLYVKTLNLKK